MSLVGAVLGDIIGSAYEFQKTVDYDYKTIPLFTDKCRYTDDTVLSIATADALLNNKSFGKSYYEWANKYPNAGYGGMFNRWRQVPDAKPYTSYGNGSAMRVSSVVDFANSLDDVVDLATASASFTHDHPEGIRGAVVTACCAYLARHGATRDEIYQYACYQYSAEWYKYPVSMSLDEMRETYTWSVTCQDSVPVALRCWYESTDYESFIRNVLSLPCDSDTLGAIGGAVAEEFYKGVGFDPSPILERYLPGEFINIIRLCGKSRD